MQARGREASRLPLIVSPHLLARTSSVPEITLSSADFKTPIPPSCFSGISWFLFHPPSAALREDILFNPVDPVIPVQKSPFHHFRAERHSSDSAKQRTRKARINHCRSLHQPLCPLRSRWLRFFSSNLQPLDIAQIDGYSLPVSSGSHSAVG